MADIKITGKGIQRVLSKFDYRQAIAEYIWNGFDAQATAVSLDYEANALGFLSKIEISDNGYGIHRTKLAEKFSPFFDSQKAIEIESPKNTSAVHGKNGVGRLTFFKFATEAIWRTVYAEKKKKYEYFINIKFESINKYDSPESAVREVKSKTGTSVTFYNILPDLNEAKLQEELMSFLCLEFGWYLELHKENSYALLINGQPLDYSALVGDTQHFMLNHEDTSTQFEVRYVRWNEKINKEFSKYYYIGSDDTERYKEFTSLNNKGDHFFHSVFIKSDYFNQFRFRGTGTDQQLALIGGNRMDAVFRYLHKRLHLYLQDKRKPYLKQYTDVLIEQYEQDKVFPVFPANPWDGLRKAELENLVRNLYEIQPKLFLNLNIEQKKTFVRLLNLLLDSLERDKLFAILDGVVELSAEERQQMADVLQVTQLARVNHTIRLIEDRYKTIDHLRDLIVRKELKANERDHLQQLIEAHYWIFGEQYHLVTAAEPKFDEALRRHIHLLRGEAPVRPVDHEDKYREMDIFLCRQDVLTNEIRNIVVELKHPNLKLGEQELTQVKKYMNVIMDEPQFNGANMSWTFYLVGTDFNSKGEIEAALDNAKPHGEPSLAFKTGQYKIYVKKWSELINEFEMKHKFLNDKLQLERKLLHQPLDTAGETVAAARANTAAVL
ncbi:ATP-binding protein [Paraflavitalea sp. CAU 1676]|uniref:ATP-binding protein n=1 Tax=Paraflavitalea sp. CAU 1676 TaxID=3032598 RepID=UPI0023DC478E|nr:ATP-binding protein [Paraflavitalea sp. CAU 1676]MDF2187951.1 ATP-binding protein [Paraflavitalea sp. CAU 1676]